ncbi:hypothetical protein Pmani_024838 [Petrolisthes manimaculis]|uniref:Regulatory protein zeste n=1 Tax=Petrolisthes manimaculis TaxID=1843537 RepID=A0AAE1P846_9EUCA|nr:hypothetical protein Pmani_024838 [Petrolisthes manimaculis]
MQRTQHMGEEERLLLLDLINQKKDVIPSKATDARMIPAKTQAWEQGSSTRASGSSPLSVPPSGVGWIPRIASQYARWM